MSFSRDAILERVRAALVEKDRIGHPGEFQSGKRRTSLFASRLARSGGEVVWLENRSEARNWLADLAGSSPAVKVGERVPAELLPTAWRSTALSGTPPALVEAPEARLAVSMAVCAVAETGSVVVDARDGRAFQMLAPTHAVFVRQRAICATLAEAFEKLGPELPSALVLHSGPSKSADIGRVVVTGIHGPRRLIAAVIGNGG